jgi:hypothetical protein
LINSRESTDNIDYASTTFLDIPEERKYNNLSVDTVNNWLFETVDVPPVKPGSQIAVMASFDNVQVSILSKFYEQLLHAQIPKVQKDCQVVSLFCALEICATKSCL